MGVVKSLVGVEAHKSPFFPMDSASVVFCDQLLCIGSLLQLLFYSLSFLFVGQQNLCGYGGFEIAKFFGVFVVEGAGFFFFNPDIGIDIDLAQQTHE